MKYIVATEDKVYWRWQILVQINNFKKLGLDEDLIYVVGIKDKPSKEILDIQAATGVQMAFVQDRRTKIVYSSSIRPHILKVFFARNPEVGKCFMYLDPDVLFLAKIKYGTMLKNDTTYVSDTRSYLCADYIKSKSPELFKEMADIVGISTKVLEDNDANAGGAQYLMKNIDAAFWTKVEKDCDALYSHMNATAKKYSPHHPIQAWTSDMWAVLWNLWLLNHETKIVKSMNFAWATDGYSNLDNVNIYHNAGITSEVDCFNKGHYSQKTPFSADFSKMNKERANYRYIEEILDTKQNYGSII